MDERDVPEDRCEMLAFVERHWHELTLRDARALCLDVLEVPVAAPGSIKPSLTFR